MGMIDSTQTTKASTRAPSNVPHFASIKNLSLHYMMIPFSLCERKIMLFLLQSFSSSTVEICFTQLSSVCVTLTQVCKVANRECRVFIHASRSFRETTNIYLWSTTCVCVWLRSRSLLKFRLKTSRSPNQKKPCARVNADRCVSGRERGEEREK